MDPAHCRAVPSVPWRSVGSLPPSWQTAYLELYDKCLLNTGRRSGIVTV